ncbi:hypothetical protein DLAC_04409 [Tieghemostelium lacteum]|uniref:Uncharacterized protein n=1 Tax=Tieghemostelium lacteum TaxID=361077 RepID=A0A151ZJF0_TIELA|nr:hypothetical protein DLAC_04409 [Tieghemostelium lacteum]|eukprot:KYQ94128.1 hypothetical protein DLAC_04409 [Tieghemostelium lacteum]
MVVPNYVIINILDLIVSQFKELEYILEFFKKFTLISSQWNKEIIPKLNFDRIEFGVDQSNDSIKKWVQFTEKYHIEYTVVLSTELQSELFEKVKNQVVEATFSSMPVYQKFKPSKLLKVINFTFSSTKNIYFNPLDNVTFNLCLDGDLFDDGGLAILNQDKHHAVLVQDYFTTLSLKSVVINENISIPVKRNLQDLTLKSSNLSEPILKNLLENSPNLKRLKIDGCSFYPKIESFDCVLEAIVRANLSWDTLEIIYHSPVNIQAIIDFINQIKVRSLTLIFSNISYTSSQQPQTFLITNTNIQSFYFLPLERLKFPHVKPFHLLDKWQDRSNFRSIQIFKSVDCSKYLNEMVHLKSLESRESNSSNIDPKQQEYINNVIIANKPSLKEITIESLCFQDGPKVNFLKIQSSVLLQNSYIRVLNITSATLSNCVDLINSNHPSLTHLTIRNLIQSPNIDMPSLVTPIGQNHTLQSLVISSGYCDNIDHRNSKNANYTTLPFYIQILEVNKTISKLQMPWVLDSVNKDDKIISDGLTHDLDKVLLKNNTIKQIYISKYITNQYLKSNINKILKKYFVNNIKLK